MRAPDHNNVSHCSGKLTTTGRGVGDGQEGGGGEGATRVVNFAHDKWAVMGGT